jgi:hypothetical protein
MPFEGGPYVQVACICENVIEDKTGALSLIRLIDVLTSIGAGPNPPEDMPPVQFTGKLVLMIKSGRAMGRHTLRIVPELPSGETQGEMPVTVHFEGEEKGSNVVSDLRYVFTQEGLHWFNIYLENDKLTAIPFRVRYNRVVTGRLPKLP